MTAEQIITAIELDVKDSPLDGIERRINIILRQWTKNFEDHIELKKSLMSVGARNLAALVVSSYDAHLVSDSVAIEEYLSVLEGK